LRRGRQAAALLIEALANQAGEYRRWAADALGDIGDIGGPEAVEPLIALLDETEGGPARWAVWSLGDLNLETSVDRFSSPIAP